MRIYMPRELRGETGKGTGLWHMTVGSDEEGWVYPVGYCAKDCPGHATPEAAQEHYRQWLADSASLFEDENQQRKCALCGAWTQKYLCENSGICRTFWVCEKHATPADFLELLRREDQRYDEAAEEAQHGRASA